MSLMENMNNEIGHIKKLVQKVEPGEKAIKTIAPESFRRLQEKVKDHGELLTDIMTTSNK